MGRKDFEGRYEERLAEEAKSAKHVRELLPIKTHGRLQIQTVEEEEAEEQEYPLDTQTSFASNVLEQNDAKNNRQESKVYSTAMLLANRRHKLADYKIKIGILSASFLEDPENRLKNLDSLLAMLEVVDPAIALTIPKFAAVSLLAVFSDVLPSYAIKHHNAQGVRLKSETKELQGHEAQVLRRYKTYLQRLEKIVSRHTQRRKPSSLPCEAEAKLGRVALDCMCKMLVSHPYFNMATNIVNFVVPFLNNWDDSVRKIVHDSIRQVFRNDKRGEISNEVVRRINVLVKSKVGKDKSGQVRREVLDVLLALRIKEVDLEKEKKDEMQPNSKMTFEQRRMLSKKQRKKTKDLVQLEKELLEASAEENKSQKSHYLTEITKFVFTIYFRTLKANPRHQTLTAVLEGLAKFAHIINIEFFEDLLKVLRDLLNKEEIHERQRLLCISTVLAVLEGQGAALSLDPVGFHRFLYAAIINLRCGKSDSNAAVALRCVRLATGRKKMPGPRAVAFAKRLATVATQLEHQDALASLIELKQLLRLHTACNGLLDVDGASASGVYLPELDDPDHACAQASTLWELTTLASHYHPWVRQVVRNIVEPEKIEPLPKEIGQKRPEEVCNEFNPYETMDFIPSYAPKQVPQIKRARMMQYRPKTEYFTEENYFNEFTSENDSSLDKMNFS